MAQERYLTPGEILSYLADLERKLPTRQYRIYLPSHRHDIGEVTQAELNDECQLMLDFAGLKGYKAEVTFEQLPDGTGGTTTPGHTPGGVVHINVSDDMKFSWKAAIATLAHEICHHVADMGGIKPNITWMTETYTDLCTIYIGFGQLVLDGYRSADSRGRGSHTLGYLDWNTYEVTAHIVNVVCGGVSSKNTGFEFTDGTVTEAVDVWQSEETLKASAKKALIQNSSDLSDRLHTIYRLEELMNRYREHLKAEATTIAKQYSDITALYGSKKISDFRKVYDNLWHETPDHGSKTTAMLETALYNLFNNLKEQCGPIEFKNTITCPCCGKTYQTQNPNKGKIVIKCATCGNHFLYDTDDWNPTKLQYKIDQRRIERKKSQEAELEALRTQIASEEKAAAWKAMQDMQAKINKLPPIIRRIVKKRLRIGERCTVIAQ